MEEEVIDELIADEPIVDEKQDIILASYKVIERINELRNKTSKTIEENDELMACLDKLNGINDLLDGLKDS
jgi:hypothetical protein